MSVASKALNCPSELKKNGKAVLFFQHFWKECSQIPVRRKERKIGKFPILTFGENINSSKIKTCHGCLEICRTYDVKEGLIIESELMGLNRYCT